MFYDHFTSDRQFSPLVVSQLPSSCWVSKWSISTTRGQNLVSFTYNIKWCLSTHPISFAIWNLIRPNIIPLYAAKLATFELDSTNLFRIQDHIWNRLTTSFSHSN